jgi:geranylgeranyl pyrophosphate synthase
MAVATGDLLFARAFAELAHNQDIEQLRVLSEASAALAAGELLQREDAYVCEVPVERYLRRCELKTAPLFAAACRLGVLVARSGSSQLGEELGVFAARIGLAFQMLDDVLDVSGPVERTGKPRGQDLLDGTVTLPFILARERAPDLGALDMRTLEHPEQAEAVCERIAATGAIDEAREMALRVVAQAKAALATVLPRRRSLLLDMVADAVVDRQT